MRQLSGITGDIDENSPVDETRRPGKHDERMKVGHDDNNCRTEDAARYLEILKHKK